MPRSDTTTMNVSLPRNLRAYVKKRVSTDGYGNVSEYLRELIRNDQKRKAQEHLEALLLEGINSGPAIPVTPEYIEEKRKKLMAKYLRKK